MSWVSVGVAAVGFFSKIGGAKDTRKAAKEAAVLGGMNARYIQQETREQQRRMREEHSRTRGTLRAGIASSGFRSGAKSTGASHKAYTQALQRTQQKELEWIGKSGKSRADIAKRGGQAEASVLRSQAAGMFGSALTSAASSIYQWTS